MIFFEKIENKNTLSIISPILSIFFLKKHWQVLLLLTAVLSSCSSYQGIQRRQAKDLENLMTSSDVFSKIFTGLALYDPELDTFLLQKDADKYYTPASNTKIFTYYTATRILGDSLPLLAYTERGDSLIFWGTGNPLLLHPEFDVGSDAFAFLQQHPRQLFFSTHNFKDKRFGPGWAWSDYRYYYQAERSSFPIFGNVVRLDKVAGGPLVVSPVFAEDWLRPTFEERSIYRDENDNIIFLNKRRIDTQAVETVIPFKAEPETIATLLADTLNRPVHLYRSAPDSNAVIHTLKIPFPDTLYRLFMQKSDNFIAEQLLFLCSHELFGYCNTSEVIEYTKDSLLSDLPDEPIWRDGSGLSRYNLFTPRTIVKVLEKLLEDQGEERLLRTLAVGGRSGTIKNWYAGEPPYVFAKTGTLSNKHCLSGFVRTRSGRLLLFSFMNNNYVNGSNPIKVEMQRVLEWIRAEL